MKRLSAKRPILLGEQKKGTHLYELGVVLKDGRHATVLVDARNSRQADAIARRAGYVTTGVTMI